MKFAQALEAAGLTPLDRNGHPLDRDIPALAWAVQAARTTDLVAKIMGRFAPMAPAEEPAPPARYRLDPEMGRDEAARALLPLVDARAMGRHFGGMLTTWSVMPFDDVDVKLVDDLERSLFVELKQLHAPARLPAWTPGRVLVEGRARSPRSRTEAFEITIRDGEAGLAAMSSLLDMIQGLGTLQDAFAASLARHGPITATAAHGTIGINTSGARSPAVSLMSESGLAWCRTRISAYAPNRATEAVRDDVLGRWEVATLDRIATWFQPKVIGSGDSGPAIMALEQTSATLRAAKRAARPKHIAAIAAFLEETRAPRTLIEACLREARSCSSKETT